MEYIFKKELNNADIEQIEAFYNSLEFTVIEQHPLWHVEVEPRPVIYFIAYEKTEIVCYSVLYEKQFGPIRFAVIQFGPLFKDRDYLISSLAEIIRQYKKRHFLYISVQLAIYTGADTDYIESKLYQEVKFKNFHDRNNWSSIIVKLDEDVENILKNFRRVHRSSIKKAAQLNLIIRQAESASDVKELANIYHKMESYKKFDSHSLEYIESYFARVYDFIKKKEKGFVLIVTEESGTVLGGIFIVFRGESARIFKGGADPEKKDLPLMHAGIFESIKIAKSLGFKYLDMWGYNHYVDKNDQIYNVNMFKRGFGGEFVFFPKIMHFQLFPFGRSIYNSLMWVKKKSKQILRARKN